MNTNQQQNIGDAFGKEIGDRYEQELGKQGKITLTSCLVALHSAIQPGPDESKPETEKVNITKFSDYSKKMSMDKEVIAFFTGLGYDVGWDANHREGIEWHEIIKDGELVCQIDAGVPLDDIVADIIQFHQGREGASKSNYKISGPDSETLQAFFKAVYDFKINHILPNGQMLLPL